MRIKAGILGLAFALALIGSVHRAETRTLEQEKTFQTHVEKGRGTFVPSLIAVAHADEPAPAPSPSVPELKEPANPGEVFSWIGTIANLVKGKQWPMLAAVILMLLVYAIRMLLLPMLKPGPEVLGIVTAALGAVMGIATGLYAGVPVLQAIVGGLFIGAAASGLWEQLFKFILPKSKSESQPLK